jgi:hypothetical protein
MPRHPLLLLVALAFASGCDHLQPTGPAETARPTVPSLGTSNGPAEPGNSFVVRLDGEPFLTSVDEENDLVVRHYDAGNIDVCGGTSSFPTPEQQFVFTPNGAIMQFRTGEIPVYIYRLSEVPPGDPSCEDLETKWLYRGTHQLVARDNNFFAEPTHGNAFGYTGNGTVYDPDGQAYHYHEQFLFVWNPVLFQVFRTDYALSIE